MSGAGGGESKPLYPAKRIVMLMLRSWKEKLEDSKDLPKVVDAPERLGGGRMVVPCPMDVYELMARVPSGKLATVKTLREALAMKYRTDTACPLTTGIFIWIAANASVEMGRDLPYWRTLKSGGALVDRYPGGTAQHQRLLQEEGFTILKRGRTLRVKDYEHHLVG